MTSPPRLHNHLCNSSTTEGLAPNERLALDARKQVTDAGSAQQDGGRDEGGGTRDDGEPLDEGHDAVGTGTHVVGRDLADGIIEGRRGRADAQEKGHFDEEDDEGRDTAGEGSKGC